MLEISDFQRIGNIIFLWAIPIVFGMVVVVGLLMDAVLVAKWKKKGRNNPNGH